ncbi:MAG: DUF4870 domain-containing protein [Fuerstiella sp.]
MSMADELQKLAELHSAGTLSDDEFYVAKQRLLHGDGFGSTQDSDDHRIYGFDEGTWCLLLHLSQLLIFIGGVGIVVPILLWVLGREKSELARLHGAHMMNWLISSFIYLLVSVLLTPLLIGIPFLIVVLVLDVLFPIVAAVKAGDGELWRYPLAIEFIREQ